MEIVVIVIVIVLAFGAGLVIGRMSVKKNIGGWSERQPLTKEELDAINTPTDCSHLHADAPIAPTAKQTKTILDFLAEHKKITNENVQSILLVSAATAERYLQKLETTGKLKQVGKTGKHTYYTTA